MLCLIGGCDKGGVAFDSAQGMIRGMHGVHSIRGCCVGLGVRVQSLEGVTLTLEGVGVTLTLAFDRGVCSR